MQGNYRALACWFLGACLSCYLILFLSLGQRETPSSFLTHESSGLGSQRSDNLFRSLGLTEKQCEATFPGLTKDIKDNIALGPFKLSPSKGGSSLQARIKGGQVSDSIHLYLR